MPRDPRFPQRVTFALVTFVALAAFAWVLPTGVRAAEDSSPRTREAELCSRLLARLSDTHLLGRAFDDALARRLFERYLDALDPERLYFLQSDVDELAKERDTLDDRLAAGDLEFARRVHRRLLARVGEREPALEAWILAEHDFTTGDDVAARALAGYPAAETVTEVCRTHVKRRLLEETARGATLAKARASLAARYTERHRELRAATDDRIATRYLDAVASAYDPHTRYLSPEALADLEISLTLELVGIGAHLASEDGRVVIMKLVAGGSAEADGRLRAGDRIVAIGEGKDGELAEASAPLDRVVRRIRGAAGTTVRLSVVHADGVEEVIALQRAPVVLVDHRARGETRRVPFDRKSMLDVGVVELPLLYGRSSDSAPKQAARRSATADVARILAEFQTQGVDAVVLDLRTTSGGLLDEALGVAGLFIDGGPLVQVKGREAAARVLHDEDTGTAWDGPLLVLTSDHTASAAEIVAGAIQDYRRGLVVGAPATYGKGTVQSIVPLGDEADAKGAGRIGGPDAFGALKVTISRFYRPLGDSTQSRGVAADLEIPSLATAVAPREEELSGALPFDRIRSAAIERYDGVPAGLIARLALLAAGRRGESGKVGRAQTDAVLDEALEIARDYALALEELGAASR